MKSTELLVLLLGLFAIGLLFSGGLARRQHLFSLGYVPFAWTALIVNGAVRVSPLPDQLERFFGFLFAALLFAGGLSYAGREVPRRWIHFSLAIAAGHTLLAFSGFESLARLSNRC